jgi:ketosteroid isomerase-like protein
MAHPNEDLVRRAFDAFATGDVDTMRELTDQDAVWHTPGRNLVSGYYRGQDEILGFFARLAELTGGTFRAELHDVVANDEHAVAIYVTRGEREGRTLENRTVLVSHVRNGKFTQSWLMSDDQYAADEFFSSTSRRWSICTWGGHSFATSRLASLDPKCSRFAHGTS